MADLKNDAQKVFEELLEKILGNREAAAAYAADPEGTLEQAGLTRIDVSGIDFPGAVSSVCGAMDLPPSAQAAIASYTSGAGPAAVAGVSAGPAAAASVPLPPPPVAPAGQPPLQTIMQHINYVTYQTYEGDEYLQQEITNIDNSTDVNLDVEGDVYGDIDVDTDVNNVNATGDGAVAAGRDVENAVTGDGSQLVDGDNYGQMNTGDGAVQAGGNINAPVNTGVNTGIIADGSVDQAVVGDNNQTVQNQGSGGIDDSVINFGDGDVTNFGDAQFTDTAVAVGGGDATNVSNNEAYDGSAIGAGDTAATQANTDVDITDSFNEDNYVDADNSVVNTEQGYGDAEQDNSGDIYPDQSTAATAEVHTDVAYEETGDDYAMD